MGRYFGTDGIRGAFGTAQMNENLAFRLGSALGQHLSRVKPGLPLNAIIGRDTRISGPALSDALILGLNRQGVYVHDGGIVPTPAIALMVLDQQADVGVAITASHNPAADNGLKLFDNKGQKLDEAAESEIEALIDDQPNLTEDLSLPRAYPLDVAASYINYLRSQMDQNCLLGWRIVLDTANGATSETSPAVFRHWGADLIRLGDDPDGENINQGVGSEYPEKLGEMVRRYGAHLGVAHDGDGDRLVVCDENGRTVDGDILLGLFGLYAARADALKSKTLVATVQSNLGLDHALEAVGARVERVPVGDRNVAAKMREIGSNLGGESSGHLIFSDFSTTGDGLLAAVKLVGLICKTKKTLAQLRSEVTLFPQQSLNLRVAEKTPLGELATLQDAIARATREFGAEGRVLVRYSGTEPKLRLLVEGKNNTLVSKVMKNLEKASRRDLKIIDS
ncbi:MAG: phosphoglucosamine mutase [Opitutales bacterium]